MQELEKVWEDRLVKYIADLESDVASLARELKTVESTEDIDIYIYPQVRNTLDKALDMIAEHYAKKIAHTMLVRDGEGCEE